MTTSTAPSQCNACSKTENLSSCARCHKVRYCSKTCQTEDWATHKSTFKRPNYIFRFQLCPDTITDPPVWRKLSVPATLKSTQLHDAMQIAFGWARTHTFEFTVPDPDFDPEEDRPDMLSFIKNLAATGGMGGPSASDSREFALRIVDDDNTDMLYGKIDRMHADRKGHPRTPEKKASKTKLFEVLDDPKFKDMGFTYLYDLGYCWAHEAVSIEWGDSTAGVVCLDGSGHSVAEDAGSDRGWLETLKAFQAERPDKEQKDKMKWFTTQASNRDPGGLKGEKAVQWDRQGVARRLELFNRQTGLV